MKPSLNQCMAVYILLSDKRPGNLKLRTLEAKKAAYGEPRSNS
jgi:hypothetical protein